MIRVLGKTENKMSKAITWYRSMNSHASLHMINSIPGRTIKVNGFVYESAKKCRSTLHIQRQRFSKQEKQHFPFFLRYFLTFKYYI